MKETIHPAESAKLFVPLKLLEPATRHGSQVNYEAADGSLSVNLSRVDSSDQDLTQLHALLSTSNSERQVGYNVIRANFFAVAGSYRGRDYFLAIIQWTVDQSASHWLGTRPASHMATASPC